MFSKFKYLLIGLTLTILTGSIIAYIYLYSNNMAVEKYELKIKSGVSYAEVFKELESNHVLKNGSHFDLVASLMKYKKQEVPSGRYILKTGMSNRKIIAKLRTGDQDALNLTFNNVWTIQELAGKLGHELESDSLTLLSAFLSQQTMDLYKVTPATVMTKFIPNTYDIFWNITPDKFIKRMNDECDKFWTKERLEKANKWSLNPEQVYTLASIVERESNNKKERPRVAGVYLNRLRIGDKLRADPTVVFANGDFTLRRVLFQHLNFDSPYNTYMYGGLPPGPIFMPSSNSIDAVLDAEQHEYYFFCAKPGYESEHAFAKTAEQHLQNANNYHKWLTAEGIK
jgi:UPF0755 protein